MNPAVVKRHTLTSTLAARLLEAQATMLDLLNLDIEEKMISVDDSAKPDPFRLMELIGEFPLGPIIGGEPLENAIFVAKRLRALHENAGPMPPEVTLYLGVLECLIEGGREFAKRAETEQQRAAIRDRVMAMKPAELTAESAVQNADRPASRRKAPTGKS